MHPTVFTRRYLPQFIGIGITGWLVLGGSVVGRPISAAEMGDRQSADHSLTSSPPASDTNAIRTAMTLAGATEPNTTAPPKVDNATISDPILEKLIGRWQSITSPADDIQYATITFTPTGKVFILTASKFGEQAAIQLGYTVDSNPKPMHVDFILPGSARESVRTIFDFTADGLLRLDLTGTQPNEPRPTTFKSGDPPFRKVSLAPTLRPDWEEISQQAKAGGSDEAEGRLYAAAILQAQFAYYLEHNTFAKTIPELGIGMPPTTKSYHYQLSSEDFMTGVSVTAVARRLGLRSFAGSVFKAPESDPITSLLAATCQTKEPSRLPPATPGLTITNEGAVPKLKCTGDAVMAK